MNKKIIGSTVVFCTCIIVFFICNKYYLPSMLVISGGNDKANVFLYWDSGNGFNKNERYSFVLDNKKTHKILLPQLNITGIKLQAEDTRNLRISMMKIVCENKEILLLEGKDKLIHSIVFSDLNLGAARFHPVLFLVQLFLSFLFGWLFYEALLLYEKLSGQTFLSKLKDLFFCEMRWVFWSMFLLSSGIYSLWLIGQWPGYMTPDSFSTWLQVKTLVFGGVHPIIYSIYKLILIQFADSPAPVAIFQILVTAGLGSYIFYFSLKNKVPAIVIILFFTVFTLSVPISIYNITLWKDIPFSLLVVFWGFYLFYTGFKKKQGQPVIFSFKKIIVLSCLLVLTCTIRHNGVIYIVFIPLLLLAARLMPLKNLAYFILTTFILFTTVKGTTSFMDKSRDDVKRFFSLSWELNPIAAILGNDWYLSEDYEDDKKTIEKLITIEDLKQKYNPRTALSLCSAIYKPIAEENEHARLNIYHSFSTMKKPLSDEDLEKIHKMYYRLILANFSIFLSERAIIFFSALGPNAIMLHQNSLEHRHTIENIFENPEWRRLAYSPKSAGLEKIIKKIIIKAYTYNGFTRGRFIVWNAYIPFILLLCALILYKWVPLSAIYSFVIMVQVPFLFIFFPESDFRYIYFIYSGGFFIIPLLLAEVVNKHKQRT